MCSSEGKSSGLGEGETIAKGRLSRGVNKGRDFDLHKMEECGPRRRAALIPQLQLRGGKMRHLQRRFFHGRQRSGVRKAKKKIKNKGCVVTLKVGFPLDAWDKGQTNKCLLLGMNSGDI
jgi:hypothetical protein